MNQIEAADETIQPPLPLPRPRRVAALVALLICAVSIWSLIPRSTPRPEVIILPANYSIPAPAFPLPDRWIPMMWGWLWQLRYALLGKPPVIDIETRLVFFGGSSEPLLRETLNKHPHHSISNGVRAWILPEKELAAMSRRLEQHPDCKFSSSRMTSGPGVLANSSMTTMMAIEETQVPVGDTISYAITRRRGVIELTGSFVSWAAVTNASTLSLDQQEVVSLQTNLTLAAIIRVQAGQAAFLYDTNRANGQRGSAGVLIQSKVK